MFVLFGVHLLTRVLYSSSVFSPGRSRGEQRQGRIFPLTRNTSSKNVQKPRIFDSSSRFATPEKLEKRLPRSLERFICDRNVTSAKTELRDCRTGRSSVRGVYLRSKILRYAQPRIVDGDKIIIKARSSPVITNIAV